MKKEVLDFIHRRFSIDNNWISGNCYYFAIILKERFPQAIIWYNLIDNHFFVNIDNKFYDWTGEIKINKEDCIEWDKLKDYDELLYKHIIRDCIK